MNRVKYKSPSIVVMDSYDEKMSAWKISKPQLLHDDEKIKEKVESMDLPLNGLASYVFHINSSIMFRDLIFTLRPAAMWAKSNRISNIDYDNMFISGEYDIDVRDRNIDIEQLSEVIDSIANGEEQELAKKMLPMSCNTEFVISIDDRTLVAFLKTLMTHSIDVYNIYGKLFLSALGVDSSYIKNRHCGDIFDKLSISKLEFDSVNKVEFALDSIASVHKVSSNLMAQFIRQHYSTVKNQLFNIVKDTSIYDLYSTCNEDIIVAMYANRKSFDRTISVRTCWFAQFDDDDNSSWSYILSPFIIDKTPSEFASILPCRGDGKNCKIREDMMAKIELRDNLYPCPILIEDPALVKKRKLRYSSNSIVSKKWADMVISGEISNNVNNDLRVEYESNLLKIRGDE